MSRLVVEPAIAVKWFVPEKNSRSAARLLDGGSELMAPDTINFDAGKVVSAKIAFGQLSLDEGVLVLEAIKSAPVLTFPSEPLLEPAVSISAAFGLGPGLTVGLVLGIQMGCRLVTASGRLYERVQDTPFASHVKWVAAIR